MPDLLKISERHGKHGTSRADNYRLYGYGNAADFIGSCERNFGQIFSRKCDPSTANYRLYGQPRGDKLMAREMGGIVGLLLLAMGVMLWISVDIQFQATPRIQAWLIGNGGGN